jgi:solute carrier family 25 (mitochondrial folate transporter), member 32
MLDIHLLAGIAAGLTGTVALYPLELLKMRMQVADGTMPEYANLRNSIKSVFLNEGYSGLYKGITPAVMAATGSWGGYFYFYEKSKKRKCISQGLDPATAKLGTSDHLLAGVEAGSIMVCLFNPLWLLKTRLALQDAKGLNQKGATSTTTQPRYTGVGNALKTIIREEGFMGLYQGIFPALLLTSHGAVQFASYEYMKVRMQEMQPTAEQPAWVSVLLGGTSKIIASTATYPYQVMKSRLQQRGIGGKYLYSSSLDCVRQTWKLEGTRGFFRGLIPNVMKVTPSAALTFVVYEESLKLLK